MLMKHVVTGARPRQTVLVTGFGTFPGARRNPTATLVAELERHRPRLARLGIALRCLILPVVYADSEMVLRAAVLRDPPDAILHLGLASRRRGISVETRAVNRAGPLHPDASRRWPRGQVLAPGQPRSLRATYPAARILAALVRDKLDAKLSIDAGDYVCNATLYRSLLARAAPRIGFIHVPRARMGTQPLARTRHRRPSIEDLTRAAVAAVLIMAKPAHAAAPCAPMAPRRGGVPEAR